jgi:hypothetical protein
MQANSGVHIGGYLLPSVVAGPVTQGDPIPTLCGATGSACWPSRSGPGAGVRCVRSGPPAEQTEGPQEELQELKQKTEDALHEVQMPIVTRLRLLCPPGVADAALGLHA